MKQSIKLSYVYELQISWVYLYKETNEFIKQKSPKSKP